MVPRRAAAALGALLAGGAAQALAPDPALALQEGPPPERVERAVELRVVLEDFFAGASADEEEGHWWARYIEEGTWRLRRLPGDLEQPYGIRTRVETRRLSAEAAPRFTDACGNRWVREWEGPAQAASSGDVAVEAVDGGRSVAFWYAPARPSLVDPGGPRGEGGCYDPAEVDPRERAELILVASRLAGEIEPSSRRPAVRDDGRFLLAVVPWRTLVEGTPVERTVRYDDGRTRFSARLEIREVQPISTSRLTPPTVTAAPRRR